MTTIELLRLYRLGPYAIFDLLLSFLGVFLLSPLLSKLFLKVNLIIPKSSWQLLTLPLGIITHLLFNQQTQMVKDFLDPNGHLLLKLTILALTLIGLKNIKIVNS